MLLYRYWNRRETDRQKRHEREREREREREKDAEQIKREKSRYWWVKIKKKQRKMGVKTERGEWG